MKVEDTNIIKMICVSKEEESLSIHPEIKNIYEIFVPFGKINTILIYSRSKNLKAFIEFDNSESVENSI